MQMNGIQNPDGTMSDEMFHLMFGNTEMERHAKALIMHLGEEVKFGQGSATFKKLMDIEQLNGMEAFRAGLEILAGVGSGQGS
jgi:hypothetical protein